MKASVLVTLGFTKRVRSLKLVTNLVTDVLFKISKKGGVVLTGFTSPL
jgi:hypothetical protein